MPKHPASHSGSNQTVIDFTEPAPETVAEQDTPQYNIKTAWIDTAGRTRTWLLLDPHGTQLAQICTKRDAKKLADLLNSAMGRNGRS